MNASLSFGETKWHLPWTLTALLILVYTSSKSQTPDWVNHPEPLSVFGGDSRGNAIARDALGNLYVAGHFEYTADFDPGAGTANLTSAGVNDIFLAKYDASGQYLWAIRMGSTNNDIPYDLALDGSGNVCLTGGFQGTVDFDPGAGTANLTALGEDIFFARYDASGNYLWAKRVGGNGSDFGSGLSIDGNGHICLTGAFENTADFDPGAGTANLTSAGSQDIFIAKYDASGNYLWAKRIGDAGFDRGIAIALDGSGNVHVTGDFENTADFDPGAGTANLTSTGSGDIFIAKYTSAGNYLWAKKIGGTVSDQGTDLAVSNTGHVYVTGLFRGANVDFDPGAGTNLLTSLGNSDIFITQYDATGNYQWAKRIGGIESDAAERIAVDGNNYIYLTGYFFGTSDFDPGPGSVNLSSAGVGDLFVAHYTASGDYVWAKRIGGAGGDGGFGLVLDGSSNLYMTGLFSTANVDFDPGPGVAGLTAYGGNDPFLLSLSAAGEYQWATNWGEYGNPPESMVCTDIARDAVGNVYATGYFNGTKVDFDPGAGVANLTSVGEKDIFLVKYDATGNYQWVIQMGSTNQDEGRSLVLDGSGNICLTGSFTNTIDFDPGPGAATLTSAGGTDMFIAKYDASGNYLWARQIGGTDEDICKSIAIDANNNLYTTGYFRSTVDFDPGPGVANHTTLNYDIFIAKYDASGNYLWAKTLMGPGSYGEGGKLVWDVSGHIYVTGEFTNTIDFDPGPGTAILSSTGPSFDIFIAKYDVFGNYVWAKRMGGILGDEGTCLALDGVGNIYATGAFSGMADFDPGVGIANLTGQGASDIFIAKYDPAGNYIWAKGIGGMFFDSGTSLVLDGNNKINITGYFYNTADFDPGAGTTNLTSAGGSDVFFAQYDAAGNYVWAKNFGGTETDFSLCMAVGGAGKINIGGGFLETVDFDPGPGTVNRTAVGQFSNIFIAQYAAPNPVVNGQEPVLTCPGDMVQNNDPGQCSAVVHYNTPASDDPQDNVAIVPPGLPSGSAFPVGTTAVTWEATDGDGLTARCTFTVTVTDVQAPSIACPPNKTGGNDPGTCSATVSYPTPTASDNCPLPNGQPTWVSGGTPPVVNGPNSTGLFAKGINTVIWKVTDAGGNTKTCSFRVIVNDVEAPQINCPANMTVNTAPNTCASAPVAYGPVTATDNCMPPNPTVLRIGGLPGGANFPTGVNTVIWRATDASGRTATCSFKVTVADAQPPALTCPDNIVVNPPPGQCGVAVFYNTPPGSDNCGIQNIFLESGLASGSTFPAGTSSIVWRATDLSGTTKTCSFTITVNCANARPSATSREQASFEAHPAQDDFALIPNPAAVGTTAVQVRISDFAPVHSDAPCSRLAIFDTQGRLIYTQNLPPDTRSLSLDVSNWVAGMYFVSLHRGAGHTRTKSLLLTN